MVEYRCLTTMKSLVFYIPITILLMVIILSMQTHAREMDDLLFIQRINPIVKDNSIEVNSFTFTQASEFKLAATGLIRLYQKFISSQDGPSCQFSPTCSRFGMACIQEYGMIRGILLAADRILRCNGIKSHFYEIDLKMNKYIDPITDYAK